MAPIPATEASPPEFSLGGQALIEGVMMRSPHFIAASVRLADGSIETRVEPFSSVAKNRAWMRLPLLRGVVALVEMMSVGMRFLNWSAQKAMEGAVEAPAAQSLSGTVATDAVSAAEAAGAAQGFVGGGSVVGLAENDLSTARSETPAR